MKKINQYIIEKFKISKNTKTYKYFPKNRKQLIEIIEKLLEERGPDAYLNDIDISNVKNIESLFYDIIENDSYKIGKIDVSGWNVSHIKSFKQLFCNCKEFDCDLSLWDTSNATDMNNMFNGCEKFTGKGLKKWDISNVKEAYYMFAYCNKFNEDISSWNVKNLIDLEGMFLDCREFNQDLSSWNVRKDAYMRSTFKYSRLKNNPPSWYHE